MSRIPATTLDMIQRHHGKLLGQLMTVFGAEDGVMLAVAIALRHPVKLPPLCVRCQEPEFRGKPQRGEYA